MFHQRAFSLIELLISLGIVAILATSAAPQMRQVRANSHLTSATNRLLGEMNFARSVAVTHSQHIIMCPSSDGASCSATGDWQPGRLLFIDTNRNRTFDSADKLLRHHEALPNVSAISSDYRRRLRYLPTGFASGTNLTLSVCHIELAEGRRLVVSNSGRIRIDRVRC